MVDVIKAMACVVVLFLIVFGSATLMGYTIGKYRCEQRSVLYNAEDHTYDIIAGCFLTIDGRVYDYEKMRHATDKM